MAELQKIEIIKIASPVDFWLVEKNKNKFVDMVDKILKEEVETYGLGSSLNKVDDECLNSKTFVGVFDVQQRKWLRGVVMEETRAFRGGESYTCFLIDLAETITVSEANLKRILHPKLREIKPLARRCSLFGIKPRKEHKEWTPAVTQYFFDVKEDDSNQLYVNYKIKTSSNDFKKPSQVKLYIKTKSSSTTADANNNNQTLDFVCLNDLLVCKKYASYSTDPSMYDKFGNCLYDDPWDADANPDSSRPAIRPGRDEFDNFEMFITYLKSHQYKPVEQETTKKSAKTPTAAPMAVEVPKPQSYLQAASTWTKPKYSFDTVFVHNSNMGLFKTFNDIPFTQSVIDFLKLNAIATFTEYENYVMRVIFRGTHLVAINDSFDSTYKKLLNSEVNRVVFDSYLNFLCPVLSLLIDEAEFYDESMRTRSTELGYVKELMRRAKNGPIVLIVCTSVENAQRLYEITGEIFDMNARINPARHFKALLLQGGGDEDQYDVALLNGVDVLIAATPFSLVKALGSCKTNLERLRYLVFDETHMLLEKYGRQISALMSHYAHLLQINVNQPIAQFLVFSNYWSIKLKRFVDSYMLEPAVVSPNRLEMSFFGQTEHVIKECRVKNQKFAYLLDILAMYAGNVNCGKNTIIFVNSYEKAVRLTNTLSAHHGYMQIECIDRQAKPSKLTAIEERWSEHAGYGQKPLLLVCEQELVDHVRIETAQCVVHYDFPETKTAFGKRLWFMRRFFGRRPSTTVVSQIADVRDEPDVDDDELNVELKNEHLIVDDDRERLCSFIFLKRSDKEHALGMYNYLTRIGMEESKLPRMFVKMAHEMRERKEGKLADQPLCPYVKTFGNCMDINPSACMYRHRPNIHVDQINMLDPDCDFKIPCEGYVRFKVAFVRDANHFFINLLGYQNLRRDPEKVYNSYLSFDIEFQLYYSDPRHVQQVSQFQKFETYAYHDIRASVYKRVQPVDVLKKDGEIAYDVIVKCIDFGNEYVIPSRDLLKIPSKFKKLPPQAIEVYLCDIRPIERDLNWSVASKIYIAEKFNKEKEFVGKVQLAAGSTLWLHPISSFKYLKALDLIVVDDLIRQELIVNNYGVNYPRHMNSLRELFAKHGLYVSKLEDVEYILQRDCQRFRDICMTYADASVQYSFLDKSEHQNEVQPPPYTNMIKVYPSAFDNLHCFYVQKVYSNKQLQQLEADMSSYVQRIEVEIENERKKFEQRATESNPEESDDEDNEAKRKTLADYLESVKHMRASLTRQKFDWFTHKGIPILCMAKANAANSQQINRAQVLDVDEKRGRIKVLYVDHGDCENELTMNDIYPIVDKFISQLPIQAIECSFENLEKTSVVENDSNDNQNELEKCFKDLTRDEEQYYYDVYAQVVDELTRPSESVRKNRKYSIRLYRRCYPEAIDLSHWLVAHKLAKMTDNELNSFFQLETNQLAGGSNANAVSKQFVLSFFKEQNKSLQSDYIKMFDSMKRAFLMKTEQDLISTQLIQTLSKSLYLIRDKIHSNSILRFLRKIFLSNSNETFKTLFVSNKGLANLFFTIDFFLNTNQDLVDYVLNLIIDLIHSSNVVQEWFVNSDDHMRALFELIEKFNTDSLVLPKIFNAIDLLCNRIKLLDTLSYSIRFFSFLRDFSKRLQEILNPNDSQKLQELVGFLKAYDESEKKAPAEDEESSDMDDEEREKQNRVKEYIIQSMKMNEQIKQSEMDRSLRVNPTFQYTVSPPHTSDEEVEEMFAEELAHIFSLMPNFASNLPLTARNNADQQNVALDYTTPKISWNQDKDSITLKVRLKNVKESKLTYEKNSISFRCQLESVQFGFDLTLYAEINEQTLTTQPSTDYFVINVKKKFGGIWPRLLTSINKPKYIKCEYNNIDESTSEDGDPEKVQKRRRKKNPVNWGNDSERPVKHLGRIAVDKDTTETNSSTDFEDHPFDLKESRDNYW